MQSGQRGAHGVAKDKRTESVRTKVLAIRTSCQNGPKLHTKEDHDCSL